MADIAVLGMEVDSTDVKKAAEELTNLDKTSAKTEKGVDKSSRAMSASFAKFAKVAGAGSVTVGAALVTMGNSVANQAIELRNMANVSNSTTQELQKMAFAARGFGVEQDKVADILKDVNDRVGDFLQTGGGPMVDFFERIAPKVGVTAEQFAKLSGAEGLLLFVDSLEKANLTQAEMTFQMEALSSDSTALLPILRNQGKVYRELGDRAEELGIILSDEVIANSIELKKQMAILSGTLDGVKTQIGSDMLPVMISLNKVLLDLGKNADLAGVASTILGGGIKLAGSAALLAGAAYETFLNRLGSVGKALKALFTLDFQGLDEHVFGGILGGFDEFSEAAGRIKTLWSDSVIDPANEAEVALSGAGHSGAVLGRELSKAGKEAEDAAKKIRDFISDLQFQAVTIGMNETQLALYTLALDGASLAQLNMAAAARKTIDEFENQRTEQEKLDALMTEHDMLITGASAATLEYSQTLAELNTLLAAGRISQDEFNAAVGRAETEFKKSKEGFDTFGELAMEAAKQSQGALADFLFDPFKDGVAGMADAFADTVKRIVAEAAAAQIMEALVGKDGTGGGILSGLFGSMSNDKGGPQGGQTGDVIGPAGGDKLVAGIGGALTNEGGGFLSGLGEAFSSGGQGLLSSLSGLFSGIGGLFSGGGSGGGDALSGIASLAGSFAGFFDKGGNIGAGQFGVVGERGPELVMGPANITGRRDTENMMQNNGGSVVNQTFNVTTPNPDAFRLSERQMLSRARRSIS